MKREYGTRENKGYLGGFIQYGVMMCLCLLFLTQTVACAARSAGDMLEGEKRIVEVELAGADDPVTVELFAYLLAKAPSVIEVELISMRLEREQPDYCRAEWRVVTSSWSGADLVDQVTEILKELDPNGRNKVLYKSPLIGLKNDLKRVKEVEPVVTGPDRVIFAMRGSIRERRNTNRAWHWPGSNRWSLTPGRGFE